MKTYGVLWLVVSIPLAMVGMSLALVLSPAGLGAVFIAFAATGAALMKCAVREFKKRPRQERARLALRGALIGGTTAGAFVGFAVLLGANVFLLAVLVLGSSPFAVGAYARWLRSATTPSAAQLDALARALAYAGPNYVPFVPSSELDAFTDEQLCQAWRASYLALQQQQLSTSQMLATVAERQKYLDEFERRNPSGFVAWLASGARAPGNPLPYLVGTRYDNPSINWDELTRGQDW
jgi:hypothetical protein